MWGAGKEISLYHQEEIAEALYTESKTVPKNDIWGLMHVSRVEVSDKVLHQDCAYTAYLSHLIHWPLRLFKEK